MAGGKNWREMPDNKKEAADNGSIIWNAEQSKAILHSNGRRWRGQALNPLETIQTEAKMMRQAVQLKNVIPTRGRG